MKKIIAIIGARPQFIKHAPLEIELSKLFSVKTIHTGQHYDDNMSNVFFEQLKIRKPEYMLEVGSHSHGKQTGLMLIEIESIILKESPDAVLVYGDTNSTVAGSIAASKLNIPVIHVESGLRSFNKTMPEELNRIITDHVSALLFTPTDTGLENLAAEGITKNVVLTGDIMKDMVLLATKHLQLKKASKDFIYTTIHRPYNTDDKNRLAAILKTLNELPLKVKFAIHPRTSGKMASFNLSEANYPNISFIPPQSYFKNIELTYHAHTLITDSGGMQKEAYVLHTKCITIRTETEWIETLNGHCNTLIFDNLSEISAALQIIPEGYNDKLYGNGNVGYHLANAINKYLNEA